MSDDAVNMVRHHIETEFGKNIACKPNRYGNKAGAQKAHEAIRPSDVVLKATAWWVWNVMHNVYMI